MFLITQTASEINPEHQVLETGSMIIYHEKLIVTGFFLRMKTTFDPDTDEINEEEMPKFSSPYVETVPSLGFLSEVSLSQSASWQHPAPFQYILQLVV